MSYKNINKYATQMIDMVDSNAMTVTNLNVSVDISQVMHVGQALDDIFRDLKSLQDPSSPLFGILEKNTKHNFRKRL